MPLSAEELLAGAAETYEVELPAVLLGVSGVPQGGPGAGGRTVVIRPLTVGDIQRITKAAKGDEVLTSALMVKQGLVKPTLELDQVSGLPAGILKFLVEQITEASGLNLSRPALQEAVQAPLARACFHLAREFGWTPEQVSAMTIGQVLLYLEMGGRPPAE